MKVVLVSHDGVMCLLFMLRNIEIVNHFLSTSVDQIEHFKNTDVTVYEELSDHKYLNNLNCIYCRNEIAFHLLNENFMLKL